MEFFMLPLLAVWTFIAVTVGRYAGRRTGRRWVKWTVLLCIWFLPWTDVLIGSVLAQWRLFQLGPVWIAERVNAPGFLLGSYKNYWSPPVIDYLRPEREYEYVEVEYTRPGILSAQYGPGYYQFRAPTIDPATCAAMKPKAIPPNIYRPHVQYGFCFEVSRTDAPISRYSYTSGEEKQTPLERWFKVKIRCIRIIDLKQNRDIGRECVATIGTWMGDGPPLIFGKARLEVSDVIRPIR